MNPPKYLHLRKKVIMLRKQGLGYRSISHRLNNLLPWSAVRRLVAGMRSDPNLAHIMSVEYSRKLFKHWNKLSTMHHRRLHLIRERGHKCEGCHLTKWQGNAMPLELEHTDGNRGNNNKSNLKLLCPNCHVFTPCYKGKNIRGCEGNRHTSSA